MAITIGELVASVGVDDKKVKPGLDQAEGEVRSFGSRIGGIMQAIGATAGLAGGAALAVGFATNMSLETAQATLSAQLGTTGPMSERLGGIAGKLYADAYGESIGEVSNAVRLVVQNIHGIETASSASIKNVTAQVLSLSQAFGLDLATTTRAIDQMLRTGLATSAEQALDILARGFNVGNDEAGDLLDTINEYGTQFRKLGLDGATAMGLIHQGLMAGARDADIVADAIKEFSIRAIDGSKLTAEGFKAIGLDAKKMASEIAAGGPKASAALDLTLQKLAGIKDPVDRSAAAVALFGTQAEDLGTALYALDPSAATSALGEVGGAAEQLDKKLSNTRANELESFKRSVEMWTARLADMPGALGVAGAAVVTYGGSFLTVVAPIGTMIAAQRAAGAAATASGAAQSRGAIAGAAATVGSAAKSVGAYTMMRISAISAYLQIQAAAIASSARSAAVWAAGAARTAAAWLMLQARAIASGAATAAAWLASATAAAASTLASAAVVVAGWTMMGLRALASAAQVAMAWLISMGPIAIVIALVAAVVAAIIMNWETIKNWTLAAWSAVSGAVIAAWNFIVSAVTMYLNMVMAVVSAVWGFIVAVITTYLNIVQAIISAVWGAIVGLVTAYMNMVRAVIAAVWAGIVALVTAYINVIKSVLSWFGGLPGMFSGWFNGAKNAASNALSGLVGFVTGIPGRIKSALGNLGSLLTGAGKDIISGLLRGIEDGLKAVWDKVSSIAGKIKSLKGPASYDKRLLIPEGNWIMDSLELGLSQGQARVEAKVSSIASAISNRLDAGMSSTQMIRSSTGTVMGQQPTAAVHIEHYHEAEGGDSKKTAEDFYLLSKARGGGSS